MGGGISCPFLKVNKKFSVFAKKIPSLFSAMCYFSHLKCILRVSTEKTSEFFHCGAFHTCAVDEMFIELPLSQKTSPPLKNSLLRTSNELKHVNSNSNVTNVVMHLRFYTSNFCNIKSQREN